MPEPTLLLMLAGVAVVAGLFRGFAGFGSGLFMAPIITLWIEPGVAVPVMLLLALAASARLVPSVWKTWDGERVIQLAIPALVAIPIGEYLLLRLPAEMMQRGIALIVLVTVAILATGWRYRGEWKWPVVVPVGFASGFLSGFAGVGAPPVVLLNMTDSDASKARATVIGYFVFAQVAAVGTFALQGAVGDEVLWYAGMAIVPFALATHVGARSFKEERAIAWRWISLILLAGSAIVGLVVEPAI